MAAPTVHLPNGQTISVSPVFGGFFFKPNDLNTHQAVLPPGWTIQIHTDDEQSDRDLPWKGHAAQASSSSDSGDAPPEPPPAAKKQHVHRFKGATLDEDSVFISSISNPSSTEFKPATSPTRQIAMMLWATLYWYFHHDPPDTRLQTAASAKTPHAGRPRGDWRVYIKREGVFRGKNLLQKLERMGLISSEDSSVGPEIDDRADNPGWASMFTSRRSFWQLDGRIFLFTLSPTLSSPYATGSPYPSRPASPTGTPPHPHHQQSSSLPLHPRAENHGEAITLANSQGLWAPAVSGPFSSASHLPTYFPPPPLQYTFTNGIRHPIRPKPPRQGETFYTRFIPSLNQYLSFRVASLSSKPPLHLGPSSSPRTSLHSPRISTLSALPPSPTTPCNELNDLSLLHTWMNNPRVASFWGESGPPATQTAFLTRALASRHSFPVIGLWDGKPFGYFEIYWVREDALGRHVSAVDGVGDWERGIHVLVGEQEFRGPERVRAWLSALVHYCFLADLRTAGVVAEPRVDNERFISYLQAEGFARQKEVRFEHKQAAFMRVRREAWEAPSL